MITRLANKRADWPAILYGAKAFAAESGMADFLPADHETFAKSVAGIVMLPNVEIILAEDEGVVGGIGLSYAPYIWNPEKIIAEELFFWVSPGAPKTAALKLLRAAEDRITEFGAHIQSFAALSTSPPGLDGVYRKLGMRPVQTHYLGHI